MVTGHIGGLSSPTLSSPTTSHGHLSYKETTIGQKAVISSGGGVISWPPRTLMRCLAICIRPSSRMVWTLPISMPSKQIIILSTVLTALVKAIHKSDIWPMVLVVMAQPKLFWFGRTQLVNQNSCKWHLPILKTAWSFQRCRNSRRLKSWLLVARPFRPRKMSNTFSKKAGLTKLELESSLRSVEVSQ